MPARGTGKRIQAKGLFATASVSRGHDWIWGDQDGELLAHICPMLAVILPLKGGEGNLGKLQAVKGWEKDTYVSIVVLECCDFEIASVCMYMYVMIVKHILVIHWRQSTARVHAHIVYHFIINNYSKQ